jgi:hypothetical protein
MHVHELLDFCGKRLFDHLITPMSALAETNPVGPEEPGFVIP